MGRSLGFIMLLIVVGIGGYLYSRQAQSVTAIGSHPLTTVEVTGVHNDLIALAGAERRYFALNSKYASIEELRTNGDVLIPIREGYSYSAQTSDTGFKIIAAYSGSDPKAPKRIIMNESMTMTTE
jgi:hypothetical protein